MGGMSSTSGSPGTSAEIPAGTFRPADGQPEDHGVASNEILDHCSLDALVVESLVPVEDLSTVVTAGQTVVRRSG
jgi:hypothetical protein